MDFEQAKHIFLDTQRRVAHMGGAQALLYWDMDTVMPPKSGPARAEVLGAIAGEVFRISTSDEFGHAIATLQENPAALSGNEARMLEKAAFDYNRFKKIPAAEYEAFSVASAESTQIWKLAKDKNDFALFEPHLQKMIDFSRGFAEYWGYENSPYDALLAKYDPDLLTAQLDPVFVNLLQGTRTLMEKVGEVAPLPQVAVSDDRQMKIGEYLLDTMGFDLQAGNLYTTEHPFTITIHSQDVRLTTKFMPLNPSSSIFSTMHEGGHGMYEQNFNPVLRGTNLFDASSMGVHESQSRFWENIVGRSRGFWAAHYDKVCRLAGTPLAPDADAYWRGVNRVQPSLVRTEADELTYNLHIIIRYEIEKAIFAGGVNAKDLPELWRAKYREYLGVVPATDAEGVMQDTHWSSAMFGYFPSYSVGNIYSAQFAAAMQRTLGPIENLVTSAEGLAKVKSWLVDNIHSYGAVEKPNQLLQRVCGEGLDAAYLLRYMEDKISKVYSAT